MDTPFAFRVSEHDPEGVELRATLAAYFAWERVRMIRGDFVLLLAGCSIGVWVAAVDPRLLPSEWRFGAEALWAMFFVCTMVAAAVEWCRHRRLQSLLSRHPANL